MEKYVLDTNLFFNMEAGIGLGDKTEEVVKAVAEVASFLKETGRAEFFMPPRIVDEFMGFFDNKDQDFLKDFLTNITVKSPHIPRVFFPAEAFYHLINDIRGRSYRGLQVAEEVVQKAGKAMIDQENLGRVEFQKKIGPMVSNLRDRYRQATRFGFLDSLADLDIIVLAQEQSGIVVSTDEGVIKWGRVFGVREMNPAFWGQKMRRVYGELSRH